MTASEHLASDRRPRGAPTPKLVGVAPPVPVFVQVAEQLIAAIHRGELPVGARLPGENELAKTFGVSRPSVREGLSCLQFEGYIEPRRGSGTVVVSTVARSKQPLSENGVNAPYGLIDVFEARLRIEPEAIGIAAEDPDPRALRALKQVLAGMKLALSQDAIQPQTDLEVHSALFRVSRNKLMAATAEQLLGLAQQQLFRTVRDKTWDEGTLPRQWLIHHEAVVDAVVARDSEGARDASRAHLVSVLTNIANSACLTRSDRKRIGRLVAPDAMEEHAEHLPDSLQLP
jgi:DNA-binding FadR family transcriptional regulator